MDDVAGSKEYNNNKYIKRDEANHIIEIISGFFAFTTLRELSTTYFKSYSSYTYIYNIEKEERYGEEKLMFRM